MWKKGEDHQETGPNTVKAAAKALSVANSRFKGLTVALEPRESGSIIVSAIVLALIVGALASYVSSRVESEINLEIHRQIRDDFSNIRSWTAAAIDCDVTKENMPATCHDNFINAYRTDATIAIRDAVNGSPTKIGDKYYLRVKCSGGSVRVEVARMGDNGKPMADPLTHHLLNWTDLFSLNDSADEIPLGC